MKSYIGIDNGVTGSIGIITTDGVQRFTTQVETPTIEVNNYTKEPQKLRRINWREMLENLPKDSIVCIERPMVNPKAFKSTQSALRALEATLIVLEQLDIEYHYIDSKDWQKMFLSSAVIGHDDMKFASKVVAIEIFPNNASIIKKHGDGDGLLIAEYCYRKYGK